jgi:hypothetical protein
MTKFLKYITGVLFVFLLILAWQGWQLKNKLDKARSEIERLKDNQAQLLASRAQDQALILTQKELTGKVLAERDSLAKALKIRPKEVIKFIDRIVKETNTDTVEVESTFLQNMTWHLADGDQCWKWEADAQLNELDLEVNRTLFDYRNKSTEVYWWQRRKFLGLRIGKKEYYAKILPECGEVQTKSIEIKRK